MLGTTAPLWALILAAVALGSVASVPLASTIVSVMSILAGGVCLTAFLSRHTAGAIALFGGLSWALFPPFYRVLGMETNCYLALVLLALTLFSTGRYVPAFLAVALAALVRPDAVLLAFLFGAVLLVSRRFAALAIGLVVYGAVLLPAAAAALAYFGQVLPNTFYAKTGVGLEAPSGLADHVRVSFDSFLAAWHSEFVAGFGPFLEQQIQHRTAWLALGVGSTLLVLLTRRAPRWLILHALWVSAYVVGMAALRTPTFIWYYVPVLSLLPALFTAALDAWTGWLRERAGRPGTTAATLGGYAVSLVILGLSVAGVVEFLFGRWYQDHVPNVERYRTFQAAAAYINGSVPRDQTVAMEEIGIVGFHGARPTVDLYSLIHRAGTFPHSFPPSSPERIPYLLTIANPDYVFLHSGQGGVWRTNYQEAVTFPVQEAGTGRLWYYSLLRKAEQLIVFGTASQAPMIEAGRVRLVGWCVGSEEILSVELRINDSSVASGPLTASTPDLYIFEANPYADHASFAVEVDEGLLPSGPHVAQLWAHSRDRSGVFWQGRVVTRR